MKIRMITIILQKLFRANLTLIRALCGCRVTLRNSVNGVRESWHREIFTFEASQRRKQRKQSGQEDGDYDARVKPGFHYRS